MSVEAIDADTLEKRRTLWIVLWLNGIIAIRVFVTGFMFH